MNEIVINMPQTDALGLSENWLLKHCGDLHWQRIYEALGTKGAHSELMRDEAGSQLYPTFVAIRCRYDTPLGCVRTGARFRSRAEMARFGTTFFNSNIIFESEDAHFTLEMLTTFAARDEEGGNALHRSVPLARCTGNCLTLAAAPPLLKTGQSLRHGDLHRYDILGHRIPLGNTPEVASTAYEPSPYFDYNGAGLLYFAAYPTIADTAERKMIMENRLFEGGRDWALITSTVGRDLFYHRNLNLGDGVLVRIKSMKREGEDFVIHTALSSERQGESLADVFTVKRLLAYSPSFY